jgi:ATP-binding cassette subfamily B protein
MVRPNRWWIALAVALVLTWTLLSLASPALIAYGIDQGIAKGDVGAIDRAAFGALAAGLCAYLLYRAQTRVVAMIAETFLYDLRVRAFDHLQSLSMGFHDRQRSGVLVSRMTSDVDALSQLSQNGLFTLVTASFSLVVSAVILAVLSPLLMLVCVLVLVPVAVASRRFQQRSREVYRAVQHEISGTLASAQEGLAGVRVIQVLGAQERVVGSFGARNRRLYRAHLDSARLNARYFALVEALGIASVGVIVIVGGVLTTREAVSLGTVVAFVLYVEQLFGPVQQLGQVLRLAQSAAAGLRNVVELLHTRSELPEAPAAVELPTRGALALEHVSFAYEADGPRVLEGIDLEIRAGERLALVGPTGAGKSTLAKLIARWYDPTEGRVLLGGVDLRDATQRSLRERIVVVPQEGFLFAGTIRDNVRLASHGASDAAVEDALRTVGAYQRFAALPEGLDTVVQARGSRLSAGERQLVSLARVALAQPALLILDEATSQLDPATERAVEEAMARVTDGRTVIVIAHRLTTARQADRVALVDGGAIVEIGTHARLLAAGGRYATLYAAWLGGGEGR